MAENTAQDMEVQDLAESGDITSELTLLKSANPKVYTSAEGLRYIIKPIIKHASDDKPKKKEIAKRNLSDDPSFQNPKRTIAAKQQQHFTITTSNKFAALDTTTTSTATGTITSSQPHHSTNASEAGPSTVNTQNNSNQVSKKIPPITIITKLQPLDLNNLLGVNKQNLELQFTQQGIKIFPKSIECHNNLIDIFKVNEIQYYTYGQRDKSIRKVMLRGLPPTTTADELKEELIALNYPIIAVRQLTKTVLNENNVKSIELLPLWAITYKYIENTPNMKHLTGIQHYRIHIEDYIGKSGPVQCYRCQNFGHQAQYCTLNPRCMKCAGDHFSYTCTKPPTSPATCVNCKQHHPANFTGCPVRIDYQEKTSYVSQQATQSPLKSADFPDTLKTKSTISWAKRRTTASQENTSDTSAGGLLKDIISLFKNFQTRNILQKIKQIINILKSSKPNIDKFTAVFELIISFFSSSEEIIQTHFNTLPTPSTSYE